MGDHVVGIATVMRHARDAGHRLAGEELAVATIIAGAAVAAVPTDTDALARFEAGYVGTERVDQSDDLVSGDARILQPGKRPLPSQDVAMADATGLDFDSHATRFGLRNFAFDNFKRPFGAGNLDGSHGSPFGLSRRLVRRKPFEFGNVGNDCPLRITEL